MFTHPMCPQSAGDVRPYPGYMTTGRRSRREDGAGETGVAETGPEDDTRETMRAADTPAAPSPMEPATKNQGAGIVIKKYANRRLYNTGSSSYVTLEHLSEMVKQGVDFVVYDARTNEDITRQVLTQIIFEAENSGQNLLPIQFLRQLIKLYGHQIQALVPGYLEMSLDAFAREKDKMREHVGGSAAGGLAKAAFPGAEGYRIFEEQVRQNMVLFDRAMKMFTPFAYGRPGETASPPIRPPEPAPPAAQESPGAESIAELKSRLDAMQRQIEQLAGKG